VSIRARYEQAEWLEDCLREEPAWRGLLRVEEIEFSSKTESANQGSLTF
jgi:hypothetical protein